MISSKYAQDLSKKISSFLSEFKQNDYNYILKSSDVSRTNNKQLFYNLEIIGEAIKQNKKIEFTYIKNTFFAKVINLWYNTIEEKRKGRKRRRRLPPFCRRCYFCKVAFTKSERSGTLAAEGSIKSGYVRPTPGYLAGASAL